MAHINQSILEVDSSRVIIPNVISHQESLLELQREADPKKSSCDVHLICEEGYIPVHRLVLLGMTHFCPYLPPGRSNILKKVLRRRKRHGGGGGIVAAITLTDVKMVHLKAVVELLYGMEAVFPPEEREEVEGVIRMLQLHRLVKELEGVRKQVVVPGGEEEEEGKSVLCFWFNDHDDRQGITEGEAHDENESFQEDNNSAPPVLEALGVAGTEVDISEEHASMEGEEHHDESESFQGDNSGPVVSEPLEVAGAAGVGRSEEHADDDDDEEEVEYLGFAESTPRTKRYRLRSGRKRCEGGGGGGGRSMRTKTEHPAGGARMEESDSSDHCPLLVKLSKMISKKRKSEEQKGGEGSNPETPPPPSLSPPPPSHPPPPPHPSLSPPPHPPPPSDDEFGLNCMFCSEWFSTELELAMHLHYSCGRHLKFDFMKRVCLFCSSSLENASPIAFMAHVSACHSEKRRSRRRKDETSSKQGAAAAADSEVASTSSELTPPTREHSNEQETPPETIKNNTEEIDSNSKLCVGVHLSMMELRVVTDRLEDDQILRIKDKLQRGEGFQWTRPQLEAGWRWWVFKNSEQNRASSASAPATLEHLAPPPNSQAGTGNNEMNVGVDVIYNLSSNNEVESVITPRLDPRIQRGSTSNPPAAVEVKQEPDGPGIGDTSVVVESGRVEDADSSNESQASRKRARASSMSGGGESPSKKKSPPPEEPDDDELKCNFCETLFFQETHLQTHLYSACANHLEFDFANRICLSCSGSGENISVSAFMEHVSRCCAKRRERDAGRRSSGVEAAVSEMADDDDDDDDEIGGKGGTGMAGMEQQVVELGEPPQTDGEEEDSVEPQDVEEGAGGRELEGLTDTSESELSSHSPLHSEFESLPTPTVALAPTSQNEVNKGTSSAPHPERLSPPNHSTSSSCNNSRQPSISIPLGRQSSSSPQLQLPPRYDVVRGGHNNQVRPHLSPPPPQQMGTTGFHHRQPVYRIVRRFLQPPQPNSKR